ncbi:MAG: signal peptidase II [Fimbriimonadaceae bacterium]|jgi:signal peptidase II|nr:signal peptidase II [Fimbriimonadaceae bacterium]
MHSKFRSAFVLFLILVAADQALKYWAREAADWVEGRTIWAIWPGVFEFKLVFNKGIAFGMMQGGGWLFAPVALLIAAVALGWSYRHSGEAKVKHIVAGVLAAGAIGNLIDRVWKQKVTDMFWFRLIDFPVFNIADVCISVAGISIFLGILYETFAPSKPAPQGALETSDQPKSLTEDTRIEKE